jgi:hypothetical protein
MSLVRMPIICGGVNNQVGVGQADIGAQLTTDAYVVLAGSEISAVEWDEFVMRFTNTGGTNSGTVQVYGSDAEDFTGEAAVGSATGIAAGNSWALHLSRVLSEATAPILYRYLRAKIKATAGGAQTTVSAKFTARRI